jgi:hypothetical protein
MTENNMYVLRSFAEAEISERYNKAIKQANESPEGLQQALNWEGKKYKGDIETQRARFIKFLEGKRDKAIAHKLAEIDSVNAAPDFTGRLILTVEWKKSRMWRSNPRVSTNYGFTGSSIGGCGYDKLSTATAEALNNDKRVLKLLYLAKNEALKTETGNQNDINRKVLGYGSGYSVVPHFEGGVGVSCHQHIIERLGLKWDDVTSTDSTDVYLIERA